MTPTPSTNCSAPHAREREPQRLLFVFVSAELPADATEAERQRFEKTAAAR